MRPSGVPLEAILSRPRSPSYNPPVCPSPVAPHSLSPFTNISPRPQTPDRTRLRALAAVNELMEGVEGGADPLLLHACRLALSRALAAALRPELQAAIRDSSDPPEQPYRCGLSCCQLAGT